ncbi:hypothetical protein H2198_003343 [Neophaeococcomyces mojaviensis]|uniref:Uncharacterized protein n=1 Tax=Neophaeococcomyces mojaviensis TaxID=3383035 RepID=A0ACC3ACG8_9EURO|nr:hypothetical protein H2198_003343 [Knufia sp. JES_112]
MGKVKRQQKQKSKLHHHQSPTKAGPNNIKRRQHSQTKPSGLTQKRSLEHVANGPLNQRTKARVPFSKYDHILLVGEGDFSFALSLVQNHDVAEVVATSFDDKETLTAKYPKVHNTLQQLQTYNICNPTPPQANGAEQEAEWDGFSSDDDSDHDEPRIASANKALSISILHGIDATKLFKTHRKALTPYAPFTKIVFNFPHTGGLSTDVNRQVRANQELLVAFFNAAKPLLATSTHPAHCVNQHNDKVSEHAFEESIDDDAGSDSALKTGHILVTLFEGEPYTLWNIRDLARHCGLQVIESFKFPWAAYPGYQHARTIGDITNGKDRTQEGKRKGAWRGEEREARCYVLGIKDAGQQGLSDRKKRSRADDSDESN